MKKKNKIFKGMLLSMTLITMISAKSHIAEANNCKDTTFKEFYSGYNLVKTGYRYKSDDTSAYIYNSGSPCGVYVDVWGANGNVELYRDGRGYVFEKFDGQESNCNYNGSVLVGKGQSKKLLNNVHERGYNGAELIMTGNQLRVHLSGVWSPDSV